MQLFPNTRWDDNQWTEFRLEYGAEPTAPGLNQKQFWKFRQDMSVIQQRRLDAFAEFDKDCDGFLNQSEMAEAAAALYPVSLPA